MCQQGSGEVQNKTGNPRLDYLIDKNAETVRQLDKLAEENGKLIELIHQSRAKRLIPENARP